MAGAYPTLSVVIPTLNEEAILSECISHICKTDPNVEIIIADGGSTDRTLKVAVEHGARVCCSEKGRGSQCNAGAALAYGDILIFLHADTKLPEEAISQLKKIFQDDSVLVGTFHISFDTQHWLLRLFCWLSRFDMGRFRFGDHCIVIRKSFFDTLGGFPNWRLFEDIELIRKARKKTRIYRFPMTVVTSARRLIQNGIIRQQVRNIYFTSLYLLGVSPEKLATMYEREKKGLNGVYLIIFVRFPHPGKVKTRLATSIGNDKAARLYRLCTENVFKETTKLSDNILRYIFYTDKDDEDNVIKWAGPAFHFMSQVEGDLGIRIEAAFNYVFRQGARKAVIVASDVPDLSAEIIENAISALIDNDIVIGPTNDGGYYLLGMNRLHSDLFRGVTWSTTKVYDETLSIVEYLGLKVHCLRALDDIDTEEDLHRWLDASSKEGNPVRRAMQNIATTS